jgi:chromatin remodeling complex protein RSC6
MATFRRHAQTNEDPGLPASKAPLHRQLICYNSRDHAARHACDKDGANMAKTTPKVKNSAFMKPMQPSEHLAKIVGTEPLPRSEVTKKIWAHIKKHKLQNPKNKREILADDKLEPIFGSKKLDMFQMTKAVNKHLK